MPRRKKEAVPPVVEQEEIAPPQPEEPEEIPQQEDEPDFGEGPASEVRRAFWLRSSRFLEELVHCQNELEEEHVHELRVACRRLEASLELFSEMIGKRPMKKLKETLKEVRKLCGKVRELQVQLNMVQDDALLSGFFDAYHGELAKLKSKTAKKLAKYSPPKIEGKLELIDSLVTALIEGAEPANNEHLGLLAQPFVETRAFAEYASQQMDQERADTVHVVRLALKTLRYQAEFLEEVGVIQGSPDAWAAVKGFHQAAGKIQDIETLTRYLDLHWAQIPPARDLQLKILGRLWKERQPSLAALDHDLMLDDFEIREDIIYGEEEIPEEDEFAPEEEN